jgi:flagellar hook-associated protein 1 FlgK
MSGLSQLLETARRALLAQQMGMAVTGHNIANASTPGYSRQRLDLLPSPAIRAGASPATIGTGVLVDSVGRLRNRFIDQQMRSSNNSYGMAGSRYSILSQIEATFNEPSESGLSSAMNTFFSSWQELSTHPEDATVRNSLLLHARALTTTFQRLHKDMTALRGSLREEIDLKLDRINTLAKELTELNLQIIDSSTAGYDVSDLKDQRDLKLDELSQLANVTVSEDHRGSMTVAIGGAVIASSSGYLTLKAVPAPVATIAGTGFDQLRIVSEPGGGEVSLAGGEVGGILDTYNRAIPDYIGKLNQLAMALMTEVNKHHAAGYGLQNPPQTGINFFMGVDAATIAIDLTDTSTGAAAGTNASINNIAASSSASEPGANDIALLIAGVLDRRPITDGGGATLLGGSSVGQFYQDLVGSIGSAINAADTEMRSSELVLNQLNQQREAVSGVSIDEEMANLIKFQRAFDAAARVVNSVNEMFETIIQMV